MRVLYILTFLIGLAGQSVSADDAPEKSPAGPLIPTVTVTTAQKTEMQARVPVVGTLIAREEVHVYAQVAGHEIIEILVESGDRVKKGQALARLSRDTLEARLAQAQAGYAQSEAALTQATAALTRVQSLRSSNNAAQSALDDAIAAEANAQAGLAQAQAAVKLAQLDLDRTVITSPVAGKIVERNATLGTMSGGSSPLFIVIEDGEIEMSAEVIETALLDLNHGDPAEISVSGIGQVMGTVRLVPASVDPVTRLGNMRISLQKTQGLRRGLFASGWVITAKRNVIAVPATSILSDDNGEQVQVVKDGIVHSRMVEAGLLANGQREIIKGVAEGEQVMTRAGAFFRDGDKVKVAAESADEPTRTAAEAEAKADSP